LSIGPGYAEACDAAAQRDSVGRISARIPRCTPFGSKTDEHD
jgi:hypothetical protein